MKRAVVLVNAAGYLQGSAFALVPGLGNVLRAPPFHLSSAAYSTLFLPAMGGAILGAASAASLARRIGTPGLLRVGLIANLAALVLLIASAAAPGTALSYAALLLEEALLGIAFGATLSAINELAADLFPKGATASITILNALMGAGTAISPLILDAAIHVAKWWYWPALLFVLFAASLVASIGAFQTSSHAARPTAPGRVPVRLWVFFAAVVVYAICEGTFSSWASIFVHAERGQTLAAGEFALSAFWAALTLTRVVIGLLARWLPPRTIYPTSPIAIAIVFFMVPALAGAGPLIGIFAAGGAACSFFYPFSAAFAIEENPQREAQASGYLVAALMIGEGIGSYALGPVQSAHLLSLAAIYRYSAGWGVLLFVLAAYLTWSHRRAAASRLPSAR